MNDFQNYNFSRTFGIIIILGIHILDLMCLELNNHFSLHEQVLIIRDGEQARLLNNGLNTFAKKERRG